VIKTQTLSRHSLPLLQQVECDVENVKKNARLQSGTCTVVQVLDVEDVNMYTIFRVEEEEKMKNFDGK
jgi:hypothetical protein